MAAVTSLDWSEWLPWRCWVCQGELDEDQQEVSVPTTEFPPPGPSQHVQAKIRDLEQAQEKGPRRLTSQFRNVGDVGGGRPGPRLGGGPGGVGLHGGRVQSSGDDGVGDIASGSVPSPVSEGKAPEPSNGEQERARLSELMKAFVNEGMIGVNCEMFDCDDGLRPGSYRIDDKLQFLTFSFANGPEEIVCEHVVPFGSVSDVLRFECSAESRFRGAAVQKLTDDEKGRLLLIVFTDASSKTNKLYFLEQSAGNRQRFLTCIRILRRYMDEQAGKPAKLC
eukprot:TRINITY_DN41262_c0_g1_i1.p1 TRINITY_DN41262_c0_g1~~TRINITY_DN41262_c0_g1_i1.p1  ORF type:complete len:302 (-),score=53.80 TRINITY_DN41262_c0_g1_i1:50-886(-)